MALPKSAQFAKFQALKKQRKQMCIDDSKPHGGPSTAEALGKTYSAEEQEQAATKIQSVWRGRQARKRVERMRSAEGKAHEAKIRENLWGDEDPTDADHEAATKIQSVWRGRQARMRVDRMRSAEGKAHETKLRENLWADSEPSSPKVSSGKALTDAYSRAYTAAEELERKIAATKIQSVWRGHQARKDYARMRSAEGLAHEAKLRQSLWEEDDSEDEILRFIAFLEREQKAQADEYGSMGGTRRLVMRKKITAICNLLKKGSGPSYTYVKNKLAKKRRARRKSTFIDKRQREYPHSNFLTDLIAKYRSSLAPTRSDSPCMTLAVTAPVETTGKMGKRKINLRRGKRKSKFGSSKRKKSTRVTVSVKGRVSRRK